MILREAESKRVQLVLERSSEGRRFQVFAHKPAKTADTPWMLHGLGELVMPEDEAIASPARVKLDAVQARCFRRWSRRRSSTRRWSSTASPWVGLPLARNRVARRGGAGREPPATRGERDPRVVLDARRDGRGLPGPGALLPTDAPRDFVFSSLPGGSTTSALGRAAVFAVHAVQATEEAEPDTRIGDLTITDGDRRVVAAVRRACLQRVQLDAPTANAAPARVEAPSSAWPNFCSRRTRGVSA